MIVKTNGKTPLIYAYEACKYAMFQYLLNHGANPNIEYNSELKIIHKVCIDNESTFLESLLEHGALMNVYDSYGNSPLHFAAAKSYKCLSILLERSAYANAKNNYGVTPLHIACHYGNYDSVVKLLNYGAMKHTQISDVHYYFFFKILLQILILLYLTFFNLFIYTLETPLMMCLLNNILDENIFKVKQSEIYQKFQTEIPDIKQKIIIELIGKVGIYKVESQLHGLVFIQNKLNSVRII